MSERSDELPESRQHMSAIDVARYMHKEGRRVGRKYRTYGEVWDAPSEIVQTGLLHMILGELERAREQQKPKKDALQVHRLWLLKYHDLVSALIKKHSQERERISKFCKLELLGRDVCHLYIDEFVSAFHMHIEAGDYWWSFREFGQLEEQVDRLRAVKTINDIERLDGIGKKRADKIRTKMACKQPIT